MILLIGLTGGLGALARYELGRAVHRRTARSDFATVVINLSGAFAMGCVLGIDALRQMESVVLVTVAGGFLGGFTTFSTWMLDTVILAADRDQGSYRAAANLVITLLGGLALFSAGRWLAAALL